MDESLFERGKALEEKFFQDKDQELLEKLRQELASKDMRDALSAVSGISDEPTLDAMIANNVTAESLTGLSMVPLVAMAWADGEMQSAEAEAILKAAKESGIQDGTASFDLLKHWLATKPEPDLLSTWKEYIASMKKTLEDAPFQQLKITVIGRANDVAKAAGGFLGLGSVSAAEKTVLEELESCFQ